MTVKTTNEERKDIKNQWVMSNFSFAGRISFWTIPKKASLGNKTALIYRILHNYQLTYI